MMIYDPNEIIESLMWYGISYSFVSGYLFNKIDDEKNHTKNIYIF